MGRVYLLAHLLPHLLASSRSHWDDYYSSIQTLEDKKNGRLCWLVDTFPFGCLLSRLGIRGDDGDEWEVNIVIWKEATLPHHALPSISS